MDLSIIVPYAGEYPSLFFTVASIFEDLRDRGIEFEVIAIDNHCPELEAQGHKDRRSRKGLDAAAGIHSWLKSLEYKERLSHWQAKNVGVQASTGRVLWFCDSHCVIPRDTLWNMFQFFQDNHKLLNGTLHLANTYKLLEKRPDMYKLRAELDQGFIGYSLTPYQHRSRPYEVPCASSCGMMLNRSLWDDLGGWPQRFAYSGGEHFTNFVLATMGKRKWMFTGGFLRHHGAPRDYHYTYEGLVWNQCAAMYMVGGRELAEKYIQHKDGRPEKLKEILGDVLMQCHDQRLHVKAQQIVNIYDWAFQWEERLKVAA